MRRRAQRSPQVSAPPTISRGGVSARSTRQAADSDGTTEPARRSPMPEHVPKLPGVEAGPYPFSQVVEANGFVYLAGQVGDAPGSHGAVPGGIEAQTRAMLDNVGRLLRATGLDY